MKENKNSVDKAPKFIFLLKAKYEYDEQFQNLSIFVIFIVFQTEKSENL